MTTQYTPTLKLALPVTGELSGTWGDTVNDNITSMIEQAIAGLSTINTWTANAHTLTTANGTTSESRCAMLVAATGGGAPTAAADIICPAAAKLYVLQNNTSFAVTLKTSAGTGVAVAAGDTAFLFCDATNVNSCVTTIVNGNITGNLTVGGNATINGNTTLGNATSDTITATARFNTDLVPSTDNARDLGSAANSWKDLFIDGTATMALVAISGGTINGVSIGATTAATLINVDNLRLDGNTLSSTDTNGNVVIAPNGTGDVQLDADTVRVGDAAAAATLTSNGAGALTVTTGGAADLTLSTNSGTTSGTVVIANGANGNITLTPDGTGDVILSADRVQMGDSNTDTTLTTNGTGSLNLTTNNGTNSGTIQLAQGVNGNITLTPNGTGSVSVPKLVWSNGTTTRVPYLTTGGQFTDSANLTFSGTDLTVSGAVNAGSINATTLDLTNLEVTNIKAKDGTASITLADTTGIATFSGATVFTAGTAALPAITTTGDTNTGIFFPAADNVATTVGGVEGTRLTSTGLGIGTSSPAYKLDVVGGNVSFTNSGTGNTLYLNKSTTPTGDERLFFIGFGANTDLAKARIQGSAESAWTAGTSTPTYLQFSTTPSGSATPTERMRLDSSGNLGIGTSSPSQKLQVNGTGRFYKASVSTVGAVASSGLLIDGAGANGNLSQIGFGYDASLTYMPASIYGITTTQTGNTAMAIAFATRDVTTDTQPTERVRITQAGDVGIGTSSPVSPLTINGNDPLITLKNAGTNRWQFGLENTSSNRFVFYDNTAAAYRLIIDSSGNVGIGTTSPQQKLVISNGGAEGLEISPTAIASGSALISYNRSGAAYTQLTASALRHVWQNSGTEVARIDSSGNFMVGTTSATRFIDFEKNQNASTILRIGNTTSGTGAYSAFQLSSSTNSYLYNFSNAYTTSGIFVAGSTVLDAGGSGGLGLNAASVGIIFYTGSTERMRLTSTGLGIGTSSPSYLLDVNGTFRSSITGGSMFTTSAGGVPRLYIGGGNGFGFNRQTASEDVFFGEPGDTGTWRVRGAGTISLGVGSTATTMTVAGNGGNVGIGTASPTGKLDVTGRTYLRASGSDTALTFVNQSGGDGSITVTGSASTMNYVFNTFSTSNALFIANAGNVGVGTSSPATIIDARGVVSAMSTGVDGDFQPAFNATYSGNTAYYGTIAHSMSSVATASGFRFLGGGTSNLTGTAGQQKLLEITRGQTIFYTGDTERARIDSSGQVLIGTTSTSGGFPLRAKGGGVDGSTTVTVPSGVTTTIYTIPNTATACMCVVFGDNGSNGFCDLLFFLGNTTPQVVSSKTMYGSPPARTYSVASTTQLQLNVAMDSSTRTAVLGTIS